ncbi:MAG TPA: hypothetical protein PKW50_02355 [Syntrophomonas sp.]|nr:hypothetical protein [Syntrophomonas sp.]
MTVQKGQIISKQEFLKNGQYAKEQYEGLLVGSDIEQGRYNIGVQLDENQVVVVDSSSEQQIRDKVLWWSSQIVDVQRRHNARPDSQNYIH